MQGAMWVLDMLQASVEHFINLIFKGGGGGEEWKEEDKRKGYEG